MSANKVILLLHITNKRVIKLQIMNVEFDKPDSHIYEACKKMLKVKACEIVVKKQKAKIA